MARQNVPLLFNGKQNEECYEIDTQYDVTIMLVELFTPAFRRFNIILYVILYSIQHIRLYYKNAQNFCNITLTFPIMTLFLFGVVINYFFN